MCAMLQRSIRQLRSHAVVALVLLFVGCGSNATPEDERRLRILQEEYRGRYDVGFEAPLYVRVAAIGDANLPIVELRRMFGLFWMEGSGIPRTDSGFVYLNVYDRSGTWMLQLYWDPVERRIVESRQREHY